jgi:membrane associated rhomboid family serine protease
LTKPNEISVFAGAFAHLAASPFRPALGASGGLMGLYGFLWAYHQRRGEASQAKALLQHMFWVLLYGFMGAYTGGVPCLIFSVFSSFCLP